MVTLNSLVRTDFQPPAPAKMGLVSPPPLNSAVPQSWLEGGMAVLDEAGRVLEVNEALSGWLA